MRRASSDGEDALSDPDVLGAAETNPDFMR